MIFNERGEVCVKYYTVYKDDEIIAFGNSQECTDKLGLKNRRQFAALVSKARSGLRRHYKIVVEDLDDKTGESINEE